MKDRIRFGNHLTELRKMRGLSQAQLGALLGVTDKAVSKWENARAMPDSRILARLSELLGVTADDLLATRLADRQGEEAGRPNRAAEREKALRAKCRDRMEDRFGGNPPPEAVSRLLAEEQLLCAGTGNSGLPGRLFLLDTTAAFFGKLRERGCRASLFLPAGAEWSAFLLGASDVDPLPPHAFCPSCRHVEFVRYTEGIRVRSGWDLPAIRCRKCGKPMIRDGQDLSFGAAAYRPLADIRIDLTGIRDPVKCLADLLGDCLWTAFRRRGEGPDCPTVRIAVLPEEARYMLPGGWETRRPEDRVLPTEEYFGRFEAYPLFCLADSGLMRKLRLLEEATGMPAERVPFSVPEVLEALLRGAPGTEFLPFLSLSPVKQAMEKAEARTWADLISLAGLMHGTGTWRGNGEERAAAGEPLSSLVSFREDVYEAVREKLVDRGIADDGLAREVMENARRGRYEKYGMDGGTARLLAELGLGEAFIRSISRVKYLFPKICAVRQIRWEATLMWYALRSPETFGKVMKSG
ncbi:MAG: helix-turn-helix domain-containing protein [Clostridia bacterium]|nr:helix-turn-helix domain-containing protein [Clostridia bacterium]